MKYRCNQCGEEYEPEKHNYPFVIKCSCGGEARIQDKRSEAQKLRDLALFMKEVER